MKKRIWLLISTVAFLAVWTIGVYAYASFRTLQRNTPQVAVQSYLVSHHWSDYPDASVLPRPIATNGGYFVVVKLQSSDYQIFYTWVENRRWHAANTGFGFNPTAGGMSESAGVPFDLQQAGQNDWFSVVNNVDSHTKAILSYVEVGNSRIPFSMVQVGSFNVWVCRYPIPISMPAYYEGYDKNAKAIWTTRR